MMLRSPILFILLSLLLIVCTKSQVRRASIDAKEMPHEGCLGKITEYYDFGLKSFVQLNTEDAKKKLQSGDTAKFGQKVERKLQTFPEFQEYRIESRPLKILTYFPKDDQDGLEDGLIGGVDAQMLIKAHQIATSYYQNVIKIRPFPASYNSFLTAPIGFNCFGVPLPDEYYQTGFDSAVSDIIILVGVYNSSTDGVVAYTANCAFLLRPIYHALMLNLYQLAPFLQTSISNFQFHQAVLVDLHQITHMLGMNQAYFLGTGADIAGGRINGLSLYTDSPNSVFPRQTSQVIDFFPAQGLVYITLPRVKQYVSRIFDCTGQELLGAPLNTVDGDFSHWNSYAFRGELLTPSIRQVDQRLTKLTLLTLLESGWYTNVQLTEAWDLAYNIGAGCDFLNRNIGQVSNQFKCNQAGPDTQCNIQGTYGGPCNNPFGVIQDVDGLRCQTENPLARCFDEVSPSAPFRAGCYEAGCFDSLNAVLIRHNSEQKICTNGTARVSFRTGLVLKCPKDYQAFCASSACKQWCGKQAVCINGRCVPSDGMTPVAPPMPTPICGAIINQCTVCQYSKIDPSTVECIACQKNFGLVNNQCKSCPRQCKQGCRVSTKIRLPTFECI